MRERWTKYMNNITQWDHQNKTEINTNNNNTFYLKKGHCTTKTQYNNNKSNR